MLFVAVLSLEGCVEEDVVLKCAFGLVIARCRASGSCFRCCGKQLLVISSRHDNMGRDATREGRDVCAAEFSAASPVRRAHWPPLACWCVMVDTSRRVMIDSIWVAMRTVE